MLTRKDMFENVFKRLNPNVLDFLSKGLGLQHRGSPRGLPAMIPDPSPATRGARNPARAPTPFLLNVHSLTVNQSTATR
jgi:hypothetical protein